MLTPTLDQPCFSFLYDGKPFGERVIRRFSEGQSLHFVLDDGLEIVQTTQTFEYGSSHWVLNFTHTGGRDSGLISQLYDCDLLCPFPYDAPPARKGYKPSPATARVISTVGSNWERREFNPNEQPLPIGDRQRYGCTGGRSSQGLAPFFDINHGEEGVLLAIGWSGQWSATFTREDAPIRVQAGLTHFAARLKPGERIRTASILVMPYHEGQHPGHNHFRQIVRDHFSLIGRPGRPKLPPLATSAWGALGSDKMMERIDRIAEQRLGFDTYWIDAGWYGGATGPCPDEFEGDWGMHTGDWRVNLNYHPDGLMQVAEHIRQAGLGFLLWLEPERVIDTTPGPVEHPQWYLSHPGCGRNRLKDLGHPDAWQDTLDTLSDIISRFGLSCYRQDFNTDPLPYWQAADEPGRLGIHEVKHIMGLYTLWDKLLERFPHLIIDDCASGGRRIDIELLSRSVPLWRSDYQCHWNADPETAQVHNAGISWWIPYSGTGTGGGTMGDVYHIRSCFSAAMACGWWGYEAWDFSDDQPLEAARRTLAEFRRVQPYFACDYFPLGGFSSEDTGWTVSQYHNSQDGTGILLGFRRPQSPQDRGRFALQGLASPSRYLLEDADSREQWILTGAELMDGLELVMDRPRQSRLIYYRPMV